MSSRQSPGAAANRRRRSPLRIFALQLTWMLLILAIFAAVLALGLLPSFGEWFARTFYHPGG